MDSSSPFNQSAVPIIGAPQMVGVSLIVTFICPCEAKQAIQAVAGSAVTCPKCKKQWTFEVQMKLNIVQVAGGPAIVAES